MFTNVTALVYRLSIGLGLRERMKRSGIWNKRA